MNMDIHKLLKRQLDRAHIKADEKPDSNEHWQVFISRINQAYIEADQERYLHERSMEIFSREMMSLNEMLQKAQRIACLGYWTYDGVNDTVLWSKESYSLLHINAAEMPTNYDQFMQLVHEQDKEELIQKVERALNNKEYYECDIRILGSDGSYHWFQTIGHCSSSDKQLTGVILDIHKKKEADEKIKELNQKIVSTARRAGMVEVATSILHNIGNILNSSNVSVSLIKKSMTQNYQEKFVKIAQMINEQGDNLAEFLINNPKGKVIPQYLNSLSKHIIEEQQKNNTEVDNLMEDLNHIKQIVAMQESISGVSSIKEKVYIPEIINTALNMSMITTNDKQIEIIKLFDPCPLINVDKSKLLQIIVNLIQNARDATFLNKDEPNKEIKLHINKLNEDSIRVIVEDNGIGIEQANLNRIFAFGFTTKDNGHGFGLHSAALSAQEMGGSLQAESLGTGHGAQFVLTLPIENSHGSKGVFNE